MRRRRIALIKLSSGGEAAYPLGLASLVAPLNEAGWEAVGCDTDFGDLHDILQQISLGTLDAAGLGILSFQMIEAASVIRRIKALAPSLPVIVGGAHPTLFPKETLFQSGADIAIRGDGENAIPLVLAHLFDGAPLPDGCAFRSGSDITVQGEPCFERDLDRFGPLSRDLLPFKRYGHAYRSVRFPHASIITSRGCRYSCPHCPSPALQPSGFRSRSPLAVVQEMRKLAKDHSVRDFHFEDDAFFTDPERIADLADSLIKAPIPAIWELVNGVRPEQVPLSLLPELYASGCRRLALGVERVYENHRPHGELWQTTERIRKIVDAAHGAGISVTGYFVVGLPGSLPEEERKSLELSLSLGLDFAHYSPYHEIPGSRFANSQVASSLSKEEAHRWARKAYRRFYLNSKQLARLSWELAGAPALLPAIIHKSLRDVAGL